MKRCNAIAVLPAVVLGVCAYGPQPVGARELEFEEAARVALFLQVDGIKGLSDVLVEFQLNQYAITSEFNGRIAGHLVIAAVNALTDPSICYAIEVTNTADAPIPVFFSVDLPVGEVTGANTLSASLRVDVQDSNNDGNASVTSDFGPLNTLQRGFLVTSADIGLVPTVDVGETISTPGIYTYQTGPLAGPVDPTIEELDLVTSLVLSPGDTVNLQGTVEVDLETEEAVCSVPELPSAPPPVESGTPVPTLSQWAMILLALALLVLASRRLAGVKFR